MAVAVHLELYYDYQMLIQFLNHNEGLRERNEKLKKKKFQKKSHIKLLCAGGSTLAIVVSEKLSVR